METRLAIFRVDVSKQTGEVMLFIETGCSMRPVMAWPNASGLHDFAETLLGICLHINDQGSNGTVTLGIEA